MAVQLTMVATTQRHCKFVADFSRKRPALSEAQVMGIAGATTADKTGLIGNVSDVVAVTDPARLRQREDALVDPNSRL